jgi:hypothetical protein
LVVPEDPVGSVFIAAVEVKNDPLRVAPFIIFKNACSGRNIIKRQVVLDDLFNPGFPDYQLFGVLPGGRDVMLQVGA